MTGVEACGRRGNSASAICPRALERADIRLKMNDFHAPIPHLFALFASPRLCVKFYPLSQSPRKTNSATRSPIIIDVAFVFARMQSGMIEASATRKPSTPRARAY